MGNTLVSIVDFNVKQVSSVDEKILADVAKARRSLSVLNKFLFNVPLKFYHPFTSSAGTLMLGPSLTDISNAGAYSPKKAEYFFTCVYFCVPFILCFIVRQF